MCGVGTAALIGTSYYAVPRVTTQEDIDYIADHRAYMQMRAYIKNDFVGDNTENEESLRALKLKRRTIQTNNWIVSEVASMAKKLKKIEQEDKKWLSSTILDLQRHDCNCGSFSEKCPKGNQNLPAQKVIAEIDIFSKKNEDLQVKSAEQRAQKLNAKYKACLFTGLTSIVASGIAWLLGSK